MKKLFVPIVAMATVLVFTSCNPEDKVAPEITLPADALVIDLGDETAALKGVTAKDDKDGDVTNSLKVAGLDFVGKGNLKYSAKDKSDNVGEAKRDVTIKADKLFGTYFVEMVDQSDGSKVTYTVKAEASTANTKVVITNFAGQSLSIAFEGDGKTTTLTTDKVYDLEYVDPVTHVKTAGHLTGTATYSIAGGVYSISACDFKIEWEDNSTEVYKSTFSKR